MAVLSRNINLVSVFQIWDRDPESVFRPSVEDKNVESAFLTEIPQKIQHQNISLSWMIGLTTGEGAYKAASMYECGETCNVLRIWAKIKL